MAKKTPLAPRALEPHEYPASITAPQGAYTPKIVFAAQHPLGLYHVEDQGAGHHGVFFTSSRARRAKPIGAARNLTGAMHLISVHEDELLHPTAAREEGKHGPVSVFSLGQRTSAPKPKSALDAELDAWLTKHGYAS